MSTYLMARNRGLPITGVPVFPRRLFSASGMFVRRDCDLTEPKHLIGKRVALSSFQTTLSLLAKGDLKFEYGVPWEEIHWFVSTGEKVSFEPKPGVRITRLPQGRRSRRTPGAPRDRLHVHAASAAFRDVGRGRGAAPLSRYAGRGIALFPHRRDIIRSCMSWLCARISAQREPWLGKSLVRYVWRSDAASPRAITRTRTGRASPGAAIISNANATFWAIAWKIGFTANRKNLERFIEYSHDQGLISERYPPERLFIEKHARYVGADRRPVGDIEMISAFYRVDR